MSDKNCNINSAFNACCHKAHCQELARENERLERELAAAKDDEQAQGIRELTLLGQIDRLTAENAALRADAERYRWLCDAPGKWWIEDGGFEAHMVGQLDAAIDKARNG